MEMMPLPKQCRSRSPTENLGIYPEIEAKIKYLRFSLKQNNLRVFYYNNFTINNLCDAFSSI